MKNFNFFKKLHFIYFLHIIKANFFIKNDIIPSLELLLKIEYFYFIHVKKSYRLIKG